MGVFKSTINWVIALVVGIVGSSQALEILMLITDCREPEIEKLMFFDILSMDWRTMKLKNDVGCPVCG